MNNQQRFRSTGHGPRATNSPYASFHKSPELQAQAQKSASENTVNKSENLRNFRDLKVWQAAKELAVIIYKATQRFPQEEIYGLSSQMRKAVISISSNIAEGFNRFYKKEYQRFLMIALGSCGELESQVEVGAALGYVSQETMAELLEKLNHENRMLRKLHAKLKEDQQSQGVCPKGQGQALSANETPPLQY